MGVFHHVGTFLLFAAAILLLITSISSPVINDIGILRVRLANTTASRDSVVTFGSFGHCVLNAYKSGSDYCSGSHIGYNPANIMEDVDNTDFNSAAFQTTRGLTRVMILHPVAAVLAFVAFLLAAGSGIIGSLLASIVAALAWIVTLVVMATDFALFGIIKNHVNDDDSGSHAFYSVGMWLVLAAMILLFLATFIVLFSCFSARKAKRNSNRHTKAADAGYIDGPATTTTTRRHFWQRRTRY
ncbi:pH-response regulator [Phlyctema vagabunda]|uniref:PH-response regulator n=1 Tax=Phlyctema vagabunda TaxID=108571 RepID=A0ABR4PHB5_9HELO